MVRNDKGLDRFWCIAWLLVTMALRNTWAVT